MPPRAPASLILAIDLGSSSVRSAFFSETGVRLAATTAQARYAIRYSGEGAAELDPEVLLRRTRQCIAKTFSVRASSPLLARRPLVAVSGSAFWHGLLALDSHDQPMTPVFTWADSRSSFDAAELRAEMPERQIQLRTGCMLRAQFWPAKLRWLRRTAPALFRRVSRWTSPATFVFSRLFGIAPCSHSMASATGLYNLAAGTWDAPLLDRCGISAGQLDELGDTAPSTRMKRQLTGATIFSAIGDGAAGNLGSGADREGIAAMNYGTSSAVRVIQANTDSNRRHLPAGLFRYLLDRERAVMGGAISNAGNLYDWCLRELQRNGRPTDRARAASDSLTLLPFLVDERAPDWPAGLRGTITGLTQTTTAADISRAMMTSTFYRLADILDLLHARPKKGAPVIVSGGIRRSAQSLASLADCLGRDIGLSRETESSLRGAAVYALEKLGLRAKPLPTGELIRFNDRLFAQHRDRRRAQHELQLLLETPPPIPLPGRPAPRRARK